METIVAVCLCLIVIELAVALVFFVATLLTLRQTARAIEVLTYRIDEEVDHFGSVMRSGWLQTLSAAASVVAGLWAGRQQKE
ncbi:MAG: hypothetical protein HY927_09005 [Elusimicrobia bacterium]|nr:hypothetical protein [Elusimicrobiota bacterium]